MALLVSQIELKFRNVNFWQKGKTKEENQEQQFQSQPTTGLDSKTQIHRSSHIGGRGQCFLPLCHPKIAPSSEFPQLFSCFRILTRVRQRFLTSPLSNSLRNRCPKMAGWFLIGRRSRKPGLWTDLSWIWIGWVNFLSLISILLLS